jgi:hypothetical protein
MVSTPSAAARPNSAAAKTMNSHHQKISRSAQNANVGGGPPVSPRTPYLVSNSIDGYEHHISGTMIQAVHLTAQKRRLS